MKHSQPSCVGIKPYHTHQPNTIMVAEITGAIVASSNTTAYRAEINILSESGCDEGAYYPAQHISIYGDNGVTKLRDFCNAILEEFEKRKQEVKNPTKPLVP